MGPAIQNGVTGRISGHSNAMSHVLADIFVASMRPAGQSSDSV
jgi:hypothetical protein